MDDREIFAHQPLPIARGYRRYRNAEEVRERHDAAYYLYEIYLKYAASIAMARYLSLDERDHRVNAVLKGLVRPSLGEWVRFLRECMRFLSARDEVDPGIAAMAELLETKESRWGEVVRLGNAIRSLRTGGASARDKVSLAMLLEEIVGYRNLVLGHGAPLSGEHYREFGDLLGKAYPELLERSSFLTVRRLVSFARPQVIEGSRVECGIVAFMGLQPIRVSDPLRLPYGSPAPREDALYLLDDGGGFLSLDPFLISREEDVYFLNEAEGLPEYLSYSTGERHRPSSVSERQEALFEKILGYRVDSLRLSRIEEDCATPRAPPGAPAAEGERHLGDYRILREIGRGAMGTVYEAIQESLGRRVALKVLPADFALDPRRLERFHREARATARIHHPNIVPIYEVGQAEGTHYYAMEYIEGRSLEQVLAQERERASKEKRRAGSGSDPSSIARGVESMAALAEGLEEAHRLGLVHRDVKPSNILVDPDGRYVLVDFGLVHEAGADRITRSGEMVGTLTFMSPEQVSRRQVDARADVYSLGVLLYEILTLRPPFAGESDHAIQSAILFEEPAAPRKLNPRIGRDLENIALHALEKNPGRRYASAKAFAEDLRRYLAGLPVLARRVSWSGRALRWCRRKPAIVTVLLALLLGGLASGILAWKYTSERAELARTQGEAQAERLLWMAQRIYSEGQYQEAFSDIEAALEIQPGSLEARLLRSRLLIELQRLDEAIADLEGLVRDRPDLGAAHYLLASIYKDRDRRRAEAHQEAAERLLADTAEACHLRSMACASEEAVKWLVQGLRIDPSSYPCLRSLALAHQAQKNYEAMERDADRAIAVRPRDATGWSLRAVARRERGRLDEALEDHRRAAELAPENPEVFDQCRETLHLAGNHKGELEASKRCIQLDPGDVSYQLDHLKALFCVGDQEGAALKYQELIEENPRRGFWFKSWLSRQAFQALASDSSTDGGPVKASPRLSAQMQEAMEYHRDLSRKASRAVQAGFRSSFSPDGRQLVYGRSDRSPDSSQRAPPPESMAGDDSSEPSISPRSSGLEILDLETRKTRLLVSAGKDPAWSPDGRSIAFVREPYLDAYQKEEVWIIDLGSGRERLLSMGGFPTWSLRPDRVFFHSRTDNMLCSIAVDDPEAKSEPLRRCSGWYPAISPDAKSFAYASKNEIRIVETSTGAQVASWIAPEPETGLLVSWSPDGREISLGGFNASNLGLWIYEVEGKTAWKVFDGSVTMGVWSPDRSRLAFDVRGPFWEIWIADLRPGASTASSLGPAKTAREHVIGLLEKCTRAIEIDPANSDAYHRRAHLHDRLDQWDQAVQDYSTALKAYPESPHLYYYRGMAWWSLDRKEEAAEDLSRAIQLDPNGKGAYSQRAELFMEIGEYGKAAGDLLRLVEIDPKDPENLNNAAWALANGPAAMRDPEKALELALEADRLSPRSYLFKNTLGVAYYRAGKPERAVETLLEAMKLPEGGTAFDFLFLAMSSARLGDLVKAREYFDRASKWVQDQPDLSPLWLKEIEAFSQEATEVLKERDPPK